MTQNQWKRLNTLQHYKVLAGRDRAGRGREQHTWAPGSGLPPSLSYQVPDGATVGLIPQLHNGGAISQNPAQSCPSGESESPWLAVLPLPSALMGSPPSAHHLLPSLSSLPGLWYRLGVGRD